MVLAIISILAALLMPALKNAKFSAQKVRGMNNLRQFGLAAMLYHNENASRMPDDGVPGGGAFQLLFPYGASNVLYSTKSNQVVPGLYYSSAGGEEVPCPTITWNANFKGPRTSPIQPTVHSLEEVKNPSAVFLMAQGRAYFAASDSWNGFDTDFDGTYDATFYRPYYGKGTCFYYVDGHVGFLAWEGPFPKSKWNTDDSNHNLTTWYPSSTSGALIFGGQ